MSDQAAKDQTPSVEVKFLRQVGPYKVGEVAKLTPQQAEKLCAPSIQQQGGREVNAQKAIRVSDLHTIDKSNIDASLLTQVEMDAMGRKNVIPSPYDSHPQPMAAETAKQAAELISAATVDSGEKAQHTEPSATPAPPTSQSVEPAQVQNGDGKNKKAVRK